jgi:hypothetical protein
MKGIVFTEFLTMVEERFSLAMVEHIIEAAQLPSQGVYTSVGTYPVEEMVKLLQQLSLQSGTAAPDLLKTFGRYLLGRFVEAHPGFFAVQQCTLDFLSAVEEHIHVEVRKLYADAELPRFFCERVSPQTLTMIYRSPRGLADLAEGLIEGCALHYREPVRVEREDLSGGNGTHVQFKITVQSSPMAGRAEASA